MTPEERLDKLEPELARLDEELTSIVQQFDTRIANQRVRLDAIESKIAAATAPNPIVAKVKGVTGSVLSYLWGNKTQTITWLVMAVMLMVGPGKGCDWKLPTIGSGCSGCNPLKPPPPAPIAEKGLRVLVVYESADLSKYPASQVNIVNGSGWKTVLASKVAKGPKGPEIRVYDKDVDMVNESDLWQTAMKRPRAELPSLLVSNGETGYEGKLPLTEAELLTIVAKFEK